MDKRSAVLGLLIRDLGLGDPVQLVASQKGRLILQKAIYLAQALGLKLGYSYSWYHMGPYSPRLTKDYYQLQEDMVLGAEVPVGATLRYPAQTKDSLVELANPPDGIQRQDWLELTASLAYLLIKADKTADEAREQLMTQKPHLFDNDRVPQYALEIAFKRLASVGIQATA